MQKSLHPANEKYSAECLQKMLYGPWIKSFHFAVQSNKKAAASKVKHLSYFGGLFLPFLWKVFAKLLLQVYKNIFIIWKIRKKEFNIK